MPQTLIEAALAARRSGDALRCYDLAMRGLAEHPDSRPLAYYACLALADLGNFEQASELYQRHDSPAAAQDEDWMALRGRLRKELALRGGAAAAEHFRAAAVAYAAAFHATGKPFSGVNAASMSLLAGDRQRAERMAQAVLDVLAAEQPADESALYFFHVTRAEAALVLGDTDVCAAELALADPHLPLDATGRSRTLRQLRQLCAARGVPPALLEPLRLPEFACVLPGRAVGDEPAADAARRRRTAALFAVPGRPAEIEVAEAFQAAGVPLHFVLPAEPREALAQTAARRGPVCATRLERLLAATQDVSSISGFVSGEEERALDYARQVALGLARLRSRQTGAGCRLLRVPATAGARIGEDGEAAAMPERAPWTFRSDAPGLGEVQRRQAALIFADMTGFSRLPDRELPSYWNRLMPEIARALTRHSASMLLQSTWGDALYLVLDSATAAARAALDVLATLQQVREEFTGALGAMNVRLSIHYAPVYVGWDPVGLGKLYYGSHVSLAARIEPVTPPGSIYVTEALAAQLTLEDAAGLELSYAGEIELAKRYGRRRMFHLHAPGLASAASEAAGGGPVPLQPEDAPPERVIGCTGSLLLSPQEADWVRGALRNEVLPRLVAGDPRARTTLVMGLAPGADLLFAEAGRDWLAGQGRPYAIRTVLPAPPEVVLADWNQRLVASGQPDADGRMRAQWVTMCRVLNESVSVVNLWPAEADVVDLATRSFRERQYQRLGAYLALHSDVLVAICDPDANGHAGGAVQVLAWRRDPSRIPDGQRGGAAARSTAAVVLNPRTRRVEWMD